MIERGEQPRQGWADTRAVPRSGRMRLLVSLTAVWFMALFAPLLCILHCQILAPRHVGQQAGDVLFVCHRIDAVDAGDAGESGPAAEPARPAAPARLPQVVYDLVVVGALLLAPLRAIGRAALAQPCCSRALALPPPTPPPQMIG